MNAYVKTLIFACLATVLAVAALYVYAQRWSKIPHNSSGSVELLLKEAEDSLTVGEALQNRQLIDHPWLFKFYVTVVRRNISLNPGKYVFKGAVTPEHIVNSLNAPSGKFFSFTIQECMPLQAITRSLASTGLASHATLERLVVNRGFLDTLNIHGTSLSGYLLPGTYDYKRKPSPERLLSNVVHHLYSKLPRNTKAILDKHHLSLNELLSFAALIDIQAPKDQQKFKIAKLMWIQYRKKQRIYGTYSIKYIDRFADEDAAYFQKTLLTAKPDRLPPQAICSPDLKSIRAALAAIEN